ncbi:FAD-dependent oxidoreductase [Phenylobacterium sp.]|uniref:FAD-dependent oxidoreductase n=1 Tax=Phenylobacterium sp. TaxID=1871053 RepID=UPI00286CF029|nr:FAD-dependent oxidoreductase [Phenylobacterium sp.]
MVGPAEPPVPPEPATAAGARVAVVGAGLAGLTAALRLSQRGFQVTLYEATETLGGNLSSQKVNGVDHDVYPHMFCAWYVNFWALFEGDLGLSREENFQPRQGVKLLRKGDSSFLELENATTLKAVLANLTSGVLPAPEMFLLGFSMLDLASHAFNRQQSDQIDRLDVNGFIYSRGYATESVARLQNYMLMVIWSIQSDTTAAASYQDFIKHTLTFPQPTPFCWLLKGSLYEKIIRPLEEKLTCEIRRDARVRSVQIIDGKPVIALEPRPARNGRPAEPQDAAEADYVVLAVPGPALANLVMTGAPGARIVDSLPHLAGLQRFQSVAIPVVDVYFNKTLPGIPKEQVGFAESDYDLTVLDISQLWTDEPELAGRTALVLAASDGDAIPSLDPLERGHMMIRRLHDYLPVFEPGAHWGDPASDICWEKTHYRSNDDNKLFINDVGSFEWRPRAAYPAALPCVFFAGDFCQTDVDMATVEAAVESGLLAAQALQARDAIGRPALRGEPITIDRHEVYDDKLFLAAKLALLPFAYWATAWSAALDAGRRNETDLPADAYSPITAAVALPLTFALDWWKTAYWLAKNVVADATAGESAPAGETLVSASSGLADLGAQALAAFGDLLQDISSRQPSRGETSAQSSPSGSGLAAAFSAFAGQALRTAQAVHAVTRSAGPDPMQASTPHQRRWRAKS